MVVCSVYRSVVPLLLLLLATSAQAHDGQLRRLDDNNNNNINNAELFQYDLSAFSLRFEKCQYVKLYDSDLAAQSSGSSSSPLAVKHFVVFQLCPSDSCGGGAKALCGEPYGTYTLGVETYLELSIENQRQHFEKMCENCSDGEQCSEVCYQYQNLQADGGYVDAADYTQCQQLQAQQEQDGDNDDANNNAAGDDDAAQAVQYYIGPRCNSGSNSITIGVFSDENCWEPVENVDVEELLGAKLSYNLLRHTDSSSDQVCLSCKEENYDYNENDANDADDVSEMCETLYNAAAKCESETGLEYGFIQTNRQNGNYENQVENEFMACTFIKSLIWNSYTQTGEINYKATQDVIVRQVTGNQKFVLSAMAVAFGGLIGLFFYFEARIKAITVEPELLSEVHGHSLT